MEKFEKLDNEQKELVKYWIEKYLKARCVGLPKFIEKHLTPEPDIEVGSWYKHPNRRHPNWLIYNDGEGGYGFNNFGEWCNGISDLQDYLKEVKAVKATPEEVEPRLIEFAKSKGYVNGTKFIQPNRPKINHTKPSQGICRDQIYYCHYENSEVVLLSGGHAILVDGKWAEIIDDKSEIRESVARLEAELQELKSKL